MNGLANRRDLPSAQTARLPTGIKRESLERRFWAKVNKEGPIPIKRPDLGPCWLWTGGKGGGGYGHFKLDRKMKYSHQYTYESLVAPIPEGLQLDHLCRNRSCVNPGHLEIVSNAENIRRGEAGQHQRIKTHCPKGHPYDLFNTYFSPSRINRQCRTCCREGQRKS